MAGNRIQDHHAEQELSKYLDKYFYPTILKYYKKVYSDFEVIGERVTNKDEQLDGIDYRYVINDRKKIININIDEKSQLYYMDKNLQTFAFEINSLQRGFIYPGWLFDYSLKTNTYMIVYPKSSVSISNINYMDFHDVESYLIKRNDLLDYLNQRGFTSSFCENVASDIRNNHINFTNDNGNRYKYLLEDSNHMTITDIYFTYSYNLLEHPINLVINKQNLINMSFFRIKK